jgi:FixJ family two-component response regulator
MMPLMSGSELAERIRSMHPDVKIVFMSGYTDEAVFGQMPPDPNVTFVQKPYRLGSLLRILRESWTGRSSPDSERFGGARRDVRSERLQILVSVPDGSRS